MFFISKLIADYARTERYYISSVRYTVWYTFACIVRLIESLTVIALIILSIWVLSLSF